MWRSFLDWMGLSGRSRDKSKNQEEARVAAMLRARTRERRTIAGEFVVLDLAEVRERVGEKWPLVSRHVHLLVENILSRRVRGNGTFFRCEEGVFAILFSDKSREEAEQECGAAAREIMDYLFGQALAGMEEIREEKFPVHSGSFEVDAEELENAHSPYEAIKAHVLTQVAAQAEEMKQLRAVHDELSIVERNLDALVATASEGNAPKLVQQLETLVSKLRALEKSLYATRPIEARLQQARGAQREWSLIEAPRSPLDRLSALIERTERELATIVAAESGVPLNGAQSPVPGENDVQWLSLPEHNIDFVIDYLPLLDMTAGVKGIYLTRIKFKIGGLSYSPKQLMEMEEDKEVLVIADRLALRYLVQRAEGEEGEVNQSVLVMTLHQRTLENLVSRRAYVELASQLSPAQRPLIFFEIALDEDWKTSRFSDWLSQLQPYCRGFFFRFPGSVLPHASDLAGFDLASLRRRTGSAIGVDAGDPCLADEEARLQAMRRLVHTANEVGLRTYVLDPPDARGVTLCRAATVRYVSCEAAMPATWRAGGIDRMTVDDMVARLEAPMDAASVQR